MLKIFQVLLPFLREILFIKPEEVNFKNRKFNVFRWLLVLLLTLFLMGSVYLDFKGFVLANSYRLLEKDYITKTQELKKCQER